MKQVLLILSLFILSTGFYSCKKEYNCTCISSDTTGVYEADTTITTYTNVKKEEAEELCTSDELTIGTLVKNCSLE